MDDMRDTTKRLQTKASNCIVKYFVAESDISPVVEKYKAKKPACSQKNK
jgi:hypothetical protein